MSITAVGFLILYFGSLMQAFISRPIWGMYAYLLAFYAFPQARWWGEALPNIRWSLMAAIITVLALLLSKNKSKTGWLHFKETKLFTLFLVFLLLQYLWALSSDIHSIYVLLVVKYLILMVLVQKCIRYKKDVIGFIIVNVLGSLYFVYLGYSYGGGRLEGVGGPSIESANGLGQHLAILLTFSAYLLFVKLKFLKPILLISILLILNTLMMTESRGSLLAIVFTGFIALFFIPKAYKKQFLILLSLGSIAFMLFLGPQIIERIESIKSTESGEIGDKSAHSRIVIIKAQWEMFIEKPFIGQGHRGTLILSPLYIAQEYLSKFAQVGQARRASHNFLMGMLVDHGLIGTSIYLWMIYLCIKRLFFIKKIYKKGVLEQYDKELVVILTGLSLGLCCYMIAGLFSNNKIYEISIWLIAIIPMVHNLLLQTKTDTTC